MAKSPKAKSTKQPTDFDRVRLAERTLKARRAKLELEKAEERARREKEDPDIKFKFSAKDIQEIMDINATQLARLSVHKEYVDGRIHYYDIRQVVKATFADGETSATQREMRLTRRRLLEAQAKEQEYRTQELEGELVRKSIVEQMWSNAVLLFRANLTTFPQKLADILVNAKSKTEAVKILEKNCIELLTELEKDANGYTIDDESDLAKGNRKKSKAD